MEKQQHAFYRTQGFRWMWVLLVIAAAAAGLFAFLWRAEINPGLWDRFSLVQPLAIFGMACAAALPNLLFSENAKQRRQTGIAMAIGLVLVLGTTVFLATR